MTIENYTAAVDARYDAAMADPVTSANGRITDVAFSSEASTMIWVLNNVANPDIGALVTQLLDGLGSGGGLPVAAQRRDRRDPRQPDRLLNPEQLAGPGRARRSGGADQPVPETQADAVDATVAGNW